MKLVKIIVFVSVLSQVNDSFARTDSTGIETINGQTYVIHKVESGEGLFGLARRYSSTVQAIQSANSMTGNSLTLGQIVKVPVEKKAPAEPKQQVPATPPKSSPTAAASPVIHNVKSGETLFAIARKYNVTVEQLKSWNNLKSNGVQIGQKIKVNNAVAAADADAAETSAEKTAGGTPATSGSVKATDNKHFNSVDMVESGVATWINDKNLNPQKSIALHKTAPAGTIIKVTNLLNNRSVYVKVIGTLPETGDNENTVIIVSRAAANMLDVKDAKFRVSLNYSIPKE